jgi:hypothetical protein
MRNDIDLRTIAFSAPMTTAWKRHPSGVNDPLMEKTIALLNDAIAPFTMNIVYNTDVVPRGYANLQFIDVLAVALLNVVTTTGVVSAYLDIFVKFHRVIVKV